MTQIDNIAFIKNMTYFMDQLYIANYNYVIRRETDNFPPLSIATLLRSKLQPCVSFTYFDEYKDSDKTTTDVSSDTRHIGHAVILRSWYNNNFEIKNSWGKKWGNKGCN
jgi:hypothetical protein